MSPVDNTYISGRTLCGFWGIFEADYGCPKTPESYATLTPAPDGTLVCPQCRVASLAADCPRDGRPGRGNHWCPRCGHRFHIGCAQNALDLLGCTA